MVIGIADNTDYANIQMNATGGTQGTFALETKGGGTTNSPTINWSPNIWYGVRLTYRTGASTNHQLDVYSYTGSQCQGTATLLGTQTHASLNGGPADFLGILTAANNYPSGSDFYMGAIALDWLYGSTLTQ